MPSTITYEWIVEEFDPKDDPNDPDSDIVDVHHFETLIDAVRFADDLTSRRIGVTRDVGNDVEGLTDRAWAYTLMFGDRLGLPERFNYGFNEHGTPIEGPKVPQHLHREIAKWQEG